MSSGRNTTSVNADGSCSRTSARGSTNAPRAGSSGSTCDTTTVSERPSAKVTDISSPGRLPSRSAVASSSTARPGAAYRSSVLPTASTTVLSPSGSVTNTRVGKPAVVPAGPAPVSATT